LFRSVKVYIFLYDTTNLLRALENSVSNRTIIKNIGILTYIIPKMFESFVDL